MMEVVCIHARVAPHMLFVGANATTRYIVCHLCRDGAGAHLVITKKGPGSVEGRWRYFALRLIFTLEGRHLRAKLTGSDAPLPPPKDSREVRHMIGAHGDPAW